MKIGFIGGGKMAEGIISSFEEKSDLIVAEINAARRAELAKKYKVATTPTLAKVAEEARIIFLAVRPQDVENVATKIAPLLKSSHTLVSIVAGKTISKLQKLFGEKIRIIRVMPNLALRVKAGMCAICASKNASEKCVRKIKSILSRAGEIISISEEQFDVVTALSGSGPAYFAYMEEAMIDGAVALGMSCEVARILAEQTMFGTAKFLRETKVPLRAFIEGVCTPGGTTEAGMKKLSNAAFKKIVAKTLKVASARAFQLA